jgi:hypothetical protein
MADRRLWADPDASGAGPKDSCVVIAMGGLLSVGAASDRRTLEDAGTVVGGECRPLNTSKGCILDCLSKYVLVVVLSASLMKPRDGGLAIFAEYRLDECRVDCRVALRHAGCR